MIIFSNHEGHKAYVACLREFSRREHVDPQPLIDHDPQLVALFAALDTAAGQSDKKRASGEPVSVRAAEVRQ